uniref:Suppressor of forked domain-containing protein n=1 Tax=Eutreptiella gymnastica TaxID=73025 RepID=A0A7S1J111_9EUGL|mmetsp:Transcript_57333/g.102470  ORF Transcript_57333/g.102470 Transcript_57333/m.102470 type:complete len:927 (+) Transcript_57333:103-2883(+)
MELGSTVTDLEFEEDLQRQPYNFKYWARYLEFKHAAPAKVRNLLHERALRCLPGSYKFWFQYLQERMAQVQNRSIDDPAWEAVNNTFERALVFMNKMPRIWVEYCQFLLKQYKTTKSRQALDRALRSLPITQHERIWKIYLRFINQEFIPVETAIRGWKRYLQLEPYQVEDFIDYLESKGKWLEVINQLVKVLNDPDFVSTKGKTKHELWVKLCSLLSKQTEDHMLDNNLRTETIIRSGIKKFPAEVGQLWCALADFHIRLGRFEVARDVYEEGITSVTTVKDFTQIYDAYAHFEENLLTAKVHQIGEDEEEDEEANQRPVDEDEEPAFTALMKVCGVALTKDEDIDMRATRLDHLFERRAELLNSVLLRQNPHNVHEWINRVKLFDKSPEKVVATYTEAIATVDPSRAVGKPHMLWVGFARYYEGLAKKVVRKDPKTDPIRLSRLIFEKAVKVEYKSVDDLATVWTEYAEFEVRQDNHAAAHKVLKRATVVNFTGAPNWKHDPNEPVSKRLWKSVKLWSFYVDVEESMGTVTSTIAVYDKIIELKVATPNMILNYATYLQEHKHWEDSFKAYEKGINLFSWPQVFDIWLSYLSAFMKRYKGTKLERLRDLFEQAVKEIPEEHAKKLYLMYAKAEEDFGLTKAAMAIYNRAVTAVRVGQRVHIYNQWIKKATEYFGVTSTREIFEQAISSLTDKFVPGMCLKYAETELKLGEVDRARALYIHTSQYVDPNNPVVSPDFWKTWHSFEVSYGNEETFREMLRIRRSVTATFGTDHASGSFTKGASLQDVKGEETSVSMPAAPSAEPAVVVDGPDFEMANYFQGSRPGYVFKMDTKGLGYYKDLVGWSGAPKVGEKRKRLGAMPGEEVTFTKPMNLEDLAKEGAQGEQVAAVVDDNEIDLDDIDDVGEVQVPDAVFGGLAKEAKKQKTG